MYRDTKIVYYCRKGGFLMLGRCTPQSEYQEFIWQTLLCISQISPERVLEYQDFVSKLYILPTDKLKKVMLPLYSAIGRLAET